MNSIGSFNQTIDYIESVLNDRIDEKKVAYLSGYSYPMFSRIFSILTQTSLWEYIRARRLTEAAILLRDTEEKVIDIALKFGYDSPDSFGMAFKKFHGSTPSQVRKGEPFRLVSPIQLALSIKGGRKMEVKVQRKKAFTAAGINVDAIDSSLCSQVWERLYSNYSHEELASLGQGQSIGVCHDIDNPKIINYMAAYIVDNVDKAKEMGLDILPVTERDYAVLELNGPVPQCIHEGWKYLFEVFFPSHGYRHSGHPDFEYYYEGDMDSGEYKMELWVPIVKEECILT